MILTKETLNAISASIENAELEDGWSSEIEDEVQQGKFLIFVTFRVCGNYVEEYDYHSEVPYDCYENVSHTDFEDAEIVNIEAWDEEKEEAVAIDNLNDVEYYN